MKTVQFLFVFICLSPIPVDGKHPVILVPGLGGSQAYCSKREYEFSSSSSSYQAWFNADQAEFGEQAIQDLTDQPDLNISFPGWGSLWSVDYLTNGSHNSSYMHPIVEALVKDPYFVPNQTLRSTPYDFRKATWELDSFNAEFKQLVEETYSSGGQRKVVLVCHNLGCLHTLYFLQQQYSLWLSRYVWAFISLGGPYRGSVETMLIEARGSHVGIFTRNNTALRTAQRSWSSMAYLMPLSQTMTPTRPLLISPRTIYTTSNLNLFFRDIGFADGFTMMTKAATLFDRLKGPSSSIPELYCVHGVGVKTIDQIIYHPGTPFPDGEPELVYGDGDGRVNLESLAVCADWSNTKYVRLEGASQFHMTKDQRVVTLIMDVAGVDR